MSSITFLDLNITAAESFLQNIIDNESNVYFTFGKVDSWANESSPDTANTMPITFREVWSNMIGGKRITGNDVRIAIPRIDWTMNTVYSSYDQRNPNLYASNNQFYILTSDFNVYKCISNNGNANSVIEPTAINPNNVTQTADGYIWKYMYTLSSSEQLRFTTDEYMPVRKLSLNNGSLQWLVQESAIPGAIYAAKITSGGSGYTNNSNLIINISGDGSGATANGSINNISNTVNTITILNYGTLYTDATITISGGGGSGATAQALLSPPGGHGSDAVSELGGAYLIINPRLNNDEGGKFPLDNEYRQISLMRDPLEYNSDMVSSNSVISQSLQLTVVGSGVDYITDEIVYQGGSVASSSFSGRVLDYSSSNNLLKLINYRGVPTNETLFGANSTASKFITSVTYPDLEPQTGKLLYVDNIEAITRNPSQSEDFKIVLSFR